MLKMALVLISLFAWTRQAVPAASPSKCIPTKILTLMLAQKPEYTNPRPVSDEMTPLALAFYRALPGDVPDGPWTFAILLDGPDSTGILMVGFADTVCEFTRLDRITYFELVSSIEGRRS